MGELRHATWAALGAIDAIAHGLAQMAPLGGEDAHFELPSRSDAEVLRGDWVRVGQDMACGIEAVRDRGKAT